MLNEEIYRYYPDKSDVEKWIEGLWAFADSLECEAEILTDNGIRNSHGPFYMNRNRIVKFMPKGMRPFYGLWQPVLKGPSPLVVHVPGYNAELSIHTDVAGANYNMLQLSPLGYWTPEGLDDSLKPEGYWPVLPNSVNEKDPEGYFGWLANCIMAVKWAWKQSSVLDNRVSFFGTSQGGGTALLLGSVFADKGTRCVAAEEPFLTNYPMANWSGAYIVAKNAVEAYSDKAAGWHALGMVDTISHASRMTYPVMLTLGTADNICPPETVISLYERLDTEKLLFSMKDRGHGYQYEFIRLTLAWLGMYA